MPPPDGTAALGRMPVCLGFSPAKVVEEEQGGGCEIKKGLWAPSVCPAHTWPQRASVLPRKATASSLSSCVGALEGGRGLFSVSSLPVVVQFVPLDATQAWCGWEHNREGLGRGSRTPHCLLQQLLHTWEGVAFGIPPPQVEKMPS